MSETTTPGAVTQLAAIAADKGDRDAWLALSTALLAVAEVSRLSERARSNVVEVVRQFGCADGNVHAFVADLPRDRLRAFAVCLVGALLCPEGLARKVFLRVFAAAFPADV